MKLLNWLSGKKTNIATGCLIIATALSQVVIGIWGFNPQWMQPLIDTLQWGGAALGTWGLADKGMNGELSLKTKK